MKKTQKKAFILNECKSPYISQAIFILKDGISPDNTGVIADAERIVAAYMSNGTQRNHTGKKQLPSAVVSVCTAVISVFLSSLFFFVVLR